MHRDTYPFGDGSGQRIHENQNNLAQRRKDAKAFKESKRGSVGSELEIALLWGRGYPPIRESG